MNLPPPLRGRVGAGGNSNPLSHPDGATATQRHYDIDILFGGEPASGIDSFPWHVRLDVIELRHQSGP